MSKDDLRTRIPLSRLVRQEEIGLGGYQEERGGVERGKSVSGRRSSVMDLTLPLRSASHVISVAQETQNGIAADMANPQLCGLRIPKISKTMLRAERKAEQSISRPFAHGAILSFFARLALAYGCKPGATYV